MISATHTHSAPLTIDFYGMQSTDVDYINDIITAISKALVQAKKDSESVVVGFKQTPCPLNLNRMEKKLRRTKTNTFNVNPGVVDESLSVIAFMREDMTLKALLWHYAAHPFTVWPTLVVSADYPGYVAEICKHKLNCFSLFLQGCAGNSNPRVTGGIETSKLFAQKLYSYIEITLMDMQYFMPKTLSIKSEMLKLPLLQSDSIIVPIQLLKSDRWSIIFLPGEQFAETALAIKTQVNSPHITAAYANKDEIGYVPTREYYASHTYEYECFASCLYYMTPMKSPIASDLFVNTVTRIINTD